MGNIDSSLPYKIENNENCNILNEFWSAKKCSFNGFNKNSIIFSYDDKDRLRSDFNLVLNQIKVCFSFIF
jgi:hypothetical protein